MSDQPRISAAEIRRQFVEFFTARAHTAVPSDSLIPPSASGLMFTNAGMNQFSDIFVGHEDAKWPRVVDYQRCMRVSGKHNDLEEVGVDHTHHTLFEMLGNWSFGDYYKRDAITWAWQLLTDVWGLPKDKLYATVHTSDDEAAGLWREVTDILPAHIEFHGDKDNFWEMGATGPCGPCSEIHIDRGEGTCDCGACAVNADGCQRYVELWNLVFIQYNRKTDGSLEELPAKHVDTGMGMERVTSVIQEVRGNYDTDLFTPTMDRIAELTGESYGQSEPIDIAFRVIADHIRAITFLISDGARPANDGRGYVLRKILRRAMRFGQRLGMEKPFLFQLVPAVIDNFVGAYPSLEPSRELVARIIREEERRFATTLAGATRILDREVEKLRAAGETVIPGSLAFYLYDTRGLPVRFLAEELAPERGLSVDLAGFEEELNTQRERARAAAKGPAGVASQAITEAVGDLPATVFTGYGETRRESQVLAILDAEGKSLERAEPGAAVQVILDQTPFYATGGGQQGDRGWLRAEAGGGTVSTTEKPHPDYHLHHVTAGAGGLAVGETVTAEVDPEARAAAAAHHSGTHLLHKALKMVLGDHVKQAGSLVAPDRLRFDFTHFASVSEEQLADIEAIVNREILANHEVGAYQVDFDEVESLGIVALFGEKYGDRPRVIDIGGWSRELCGGTHVARSGDIGLLKIVSEGSIATGVRRIEALAGHAARELLSREHDALGRVARTLNVPPMEAEERISGLLGQVKSLEKEREALLKRLLDASADGAVRDATEIDGVTLVAADLSSVGELGKAGRKLVVDLVDRLLNRAGESAVVVVGAQTGGKGALAVKVAQPLIKGRGLKAGGLIKELAALAGGRGGGRPNFAQAGVPEVARLGEAVGGAEQVLRSALGA